MKLEDVKIGMKVVPHSKSTGWNMETSEIIKEMRRRKQEYLYVIRIYEDKEVELGSESSNNGICGYFLASDFEPYEKQKMSNKRFEVKNNHIELLKNMYITWNTVCFGSPTVEPKRPYGNSDVFSDMADILGVGVKNEDDEIILSEKEIDDLLNIHKEMETVLQILCSNCFIREGLYENKNYSNKWDLIEI